jgi:hypothetical protein
MKAAVAQPAAERELFVAGERARYGGNVNEIAWLAVGLAVDNPFNNKRRPRPAT